MPDTLVALFIMVINYVPSDEDKGHRIDPGTHSEQTQLQMVAEPRKENRPFNRVGCELLRNTQHKAAENDQASVPKSCQRLENGQRRVLGLLSVEGEASCSTRSGTV